MRTLPGCRRTPILRSPYRIPFRGAGFERLDFVRGEVEIAAVPLVKVSRRIVLDDDTDVLVAVDVLVHGGDASGPAREEQVLRVGPTPRMQNHPTAPGYPDTVHQHRVQVGLDCVVGQWIPPIHAIGHLRDEPYGIPRIP